MAARPVTTHPAPSEMSVLPLESVLLKLLSRRPPPMPSERATFGQGMKVYEPNRRAR